MQAELRQTCQRQSSFICGGPQDNSPSVCTQLTRSKCVCARAWGILHYSVCICKIMHIPVRASEPIYSVGHRWKHLRVNAHQTCASVRVCVCVLHRCDVSAGRCCQSPLPPSLPPPPPERCSSKVSLEKCTLGRKHSTTTPTPPTPSPLSFRGTMSPYVTVLTYLSVCVHLRTYDCCFLANSSINDYMSTPHCVPKTQVFLTAVGDDEISPQRPNRVNNSSVIFHWAVWINHDRPSWHLIMMTEISPWRWFTGTWTDEWWIRGR